MPSKQPPTLETAVELKFMEPQARMVMRAFFQRNYDAFTDSAKRSTNWAVLAADIVLAWALLTWLV